MNIFREKARTTPAVVGNGLVVLAVCLCLFPAAFSPGRDLAPVDGLLVFSPWREMAADRVSSNPLLGDVATQFLPWDRLIQQALEDGRIPLWNPYNACGQPLLGNWQAAVFYPFSLLARWLPHPYLCKALFKLICCQLAMFGFLRWLSLGVAGSLVGASLFTFCGFHTVWLAHPHSNVSVLMPLLFYGWIRFLKEKRGVFFVLTAAVVAGQLLGGHPETAFHCGFCLLVFTILFSPKKGMTGGLRPVSLLVGAYATGLLLAAVQVLPSLEYLFRSTALAIRSTATGADPYFASQFQDWEAWMGLLAPGLFGSPLAGNWVGPVNFSEIAGGFVGMAGLFLALACGLPSGHRHRLPFVAMLALCLAGAFRLPGLEALFSLYPLSVLDHKRMLLGAAFALAVLGGMGGDFMLRGNSSAKVLRRRSGAFLGVFCLLMAGHWGMTARAAAFLHPGRIALEQGAVFIGGFIFLLPVVWHRRTLAGGIIVVCALAELVLFGRGYVPASKTDLADETPPILRPLQAQEGLCRTVSIDSGFLPADTNLFSNIFLATGYDAVGVASYDAFLQAMAPFPFHPVFHQLHWTPSLDSPWLDFLNVGYVVTPASVTLSGGGYQRVAAAGSGSFHRVYRNHQRMPRAFLVSRVTAAADAETMLAAVGNGFDPRGQVLLPITGDLHFPAARRRADRCRITRYAPERIELRVAHEEPRALVLSEAWYPGWRAFVDGQEHAVFLANGAFRALLLPEPGDHEIVMTYEPLSFFLGALISLGTVMSLGAVGLLRRRRRAQG